ncbi:hypothetical protein C4D60_Mb11t22000 [Musa balbisiana]|uniref:Uncharacterized protein n=1 Tax=Musa balbisiana TaxID=52838 RepID=A0A4S8J8C4_MUSBA|nr:hypothetical protein C4D60_Mb11t22000 [Musa balbisiana]
MEGVGTDSAISEKDYNRAQKKSADSGTSRSLLGDASTDGTVVIFQVKATYEVTVLDSTVLHGASSGECSLLGIQHFGHPAMMAPLGALATASKMENEMNYLADHLLAFSIIYQHSQQSQMEFLTVYSASGDGFTTLQDASERFPVNDRLRSGGAIFPHLIRNSGLLGGLSCKSKPPSYSLLSSAGIPRSNSFSTPYATLWTKAGILYESKNGILVLKMIRKFTCYSLELMHTS